MPQAVLVDLNTIPDDDVPDDPDAPELKLVLTALKTVFRKDVSTNIKTILEELKPISDDPRMERLIRMVWYYLVSNARHMKRSYNVLYDTIKNVVEVKSMPTMLEIWKAEGKAEGEAKGKTEGKTEAVLTFLRARFHRVPKRIENTIRQRTDQAALDSWIVQAATCQSLEEFSMALK